MKRLEIKYRVVKSAKHERFKSLMLFSQWSNMEADGIFSLIPTFELVWSDVPVRYNIEVQSATGPHHGRSRTKFEVHSFRFASENITSSTPN